MIVYVLFTTVHSNHWHVVRWVYDDYNNIHNVLLSEILLK